MRVEICFVIAFMSAACLHAGEAEPDGYSKPVNGLKARLTASKVKIRKGGFFEIFIELKDAENNPHQIQMDNPEAFKTELLDLRGRLISPSSGRSDVFYIPQWVVVPARAYLGIPISQESHDGAKGSTLDTTTDIWILAPGKYQLRGSFSSKEFMNNPGDLQRPANSWSGEIELPAIALEVTE